MNILGKVKSYVCVAMIFTIPFISCKSEPEKTVESEVTTQRPHPAKSQKKNTKSPVITSPNPVAQTDAQQLREARAKREKHLDTGGLKWTTFDKIAESNTNEGNKKYLVDVYTEWCGWCKVMDKNTFTDPEIQDYLRKNFHVVKFDAEQKDAVKFKEKEYQWVSGGRKGINQLAVELLGNRMSYPTLVYLDEDLNKITASPGYKKPDQLIKELKAIVSK